MKTTTLESPICTDTQTPAIINNAASCLSCNDTRLKFFVGDTSVSTC